MEEWGGGEELRKAPRTRVPRTPHGAGQAPGERTGTPEPEEPMKTMKVLKGEPDPEVLG